MDNIWCHNGTEDITQEIRTILEAQDVKVSEAVVGEIIHACSAYYSRMLIDRNENPAVKDLEKFLSGLKKLNRSKLSSEAMLEIRYQVERFKEIEKEIDRSLDKIRRGKGRPETWARDAFIGDLAAIYYKHTGKKPGLPYLSSSGTKDRERRGPFFQFVKSLLGIVKNSPRLTDGAITTSIRKLIELENKRFKLRKKHWPEFKANHPWERLT